MEDSVRSQILNAVDDNRDQIVAYLQRLVQIDSVTGNEAEIQEFVARTFEEMGLEVDQFDVDVDALRKYEGFLEPDQSLEGRPNVVGVWRGKGGGKSMLLNGHVDTVPLDDPDKWEHGPLSGDLYEGKIAGRGVSDMKGGVAAMIQAVRILQQLGLELDGDVIVESVVDEERTGLGTLACVDRGYTADAGISCETSDLEVMAACIGRMWFTIHLQGKPTGIAARWKGVSAIEKAMKLVEAIDDLEKIRIDTLTHPLLPDNRGALPCAVTMFHSGTFPSITPENATLRGSLGLMPYEDPKEVEEQLRQQIMRVAMADPWLRKNPPQLTTEGGYVAAGAEIPTDHPIMNTVSAMFESVTGHSPVHSARMGAADTRFLIRQGNTPTVIFGPGETDQMHAVNEFLPVENLLTATKVIALAIYDWCNQSKEAGE